MKILFLGHSLIAYYDWASRFPGHEVENLGIAGETTGALRDRIGRVALDHRDADAVFVMTGTNDLLLGENNLEEQIRDVAGTLRRSLPKARIVMQSILPVDPSWLPSSRLREWNRRIAAMAAAEGVAYLDLTGPFTAETGEVRSGVLLEDGVHLSDRGYRLWSAAIEKALS